MTHDSPASLWHTSLRAKAAVGTMLVAVAALDADAACADPAPAPTLTVELGGADNDDLYTFARFDFAVLALHWRFR